MLLGSVGLAVGKHRILRLDEVIESIDEMIEKYTKRKRKSWVGQGATNLLREGDLEEQCLPPIQKGFRRRSRVVACTYFGAFDADDSVKRSGRIVEEGDVDG